jgi:hypothetical protein
LTGFSKYTKVDGRNIALREFEIVGKGQSKKMVSTQVDAGKILGSYSSNLARRESVASYVSIPSLKLAVNPFSSGSSVSKSMGSGSGSFSSVNIIGSNSIGSVGLSKVYPTPSLVSLGSSFKGGLTSVPSIPSTPSVPSVPSVPSIPSVPYVPSIPYVPSVPRVPGIPYIPSTPVNPLNQMAGMSDRQPRKYLSKTRKRSYAPSVVGLMLKLRTPKLAKSSLLTGLEIRGAM